AADGFHDVVAADARRLRSPGGTAARRRLLCPFGGTKRRGRSRIRAANQRQRRTGSLDRPRLRLFAHHRAEPPEIADDLLVDALLHPLEQVEALLLVFDQWIALAVAAQPDAFLQMVEAVEMILPLGVDNLQHQVALDALQHLATDQLFLL